jgi:hypothetical protein
MNRMATLLCQSSFEFRLYTTYELCATPSSTSVEPLMVATGQELGKSTAEGFLVMGYGATENELAASLTPVVDYAHLCKAQSDITDRSNRGELTTRMSH